MAVYYTSVSCNRLTPLLLLWICYTTCFYSYAPVYKILTDITYRAVLLRQQSVLSLLLATANHIDVVQSVMSPCVLAYVYVIQIMNEMTVNLGLRTV